MTSLPNFRVKNGITMETVATFQTEDDTVRYLRTMVHPMSLINVWMNPKTVAKGKRRRYSAAEFLVKHADVGYFICDKSNTYAIVSSYTKPEKVVEWLAHNKRPATDFQIRIRTRDEAGGRYRAVQATDFIKEFA